MTTEPFAWIAVYLPLLFRFASVFAVSSCVQSERKQKKTQKKKWHIRATDQCVEHIQFHTPILIACHNSASANTLSPPYTVRQTTRANHIDLERILFAFAGGICCVHCDCLFGLFG